MDQYSSSDDLEKIRLVEKSKRLFRGRFTYITMTSTEKKINNRVLRSISGMIDKEINSNPIRKLILALVCIVFGVVESKIFTTPPNNDLPAGIIVFVVFSTVIIYLLIIGFFSKKYNYSINLDFNGISIRDDYYQWYDLKHTAILQIGSGRGQREHLIIVLSDGTYEKYPLEGFLFLCGIGNTISTYIEYFKKGIIN